ncbi:MAG TPA: hypothetical protein PKI46_09370 [Bacteroidales bacterium]|nr:hypothetical protein [Bacteroidales bacterium]
MIKKEGSKYVLYSKDGSRKLGHANSLEEIKKREHQVQYFRYLADHGKSK